MRFNAESMPIGTVDNFLVPVPCTAISHRLFDPIHAIASISCMVALHRLFGDYSGTQVPDEVSQ
jgi:hypothetical protein